MKIAVTGKGGSGKSTLSWLLVNYLAENGKKVLAIDADHNEDLIANLGISSSQITSIQKSHADFRNYLGMYPNDLWSSLTERDYTRLAKFKFPDLDDFSKKIISQLSPNISVASVGLGEDDILFSAKCAHGHSAPLKFYLPLLEAERDSHVVIDGVAGLDMVNYGLFLGCDAVIISVENHINSIRVANSIIEIHDRLNVPTFVVLNKGGEQDDPAFSQFSSLILGSIPLDLELLKLNFGLISNETFDSMKEIWKKVGLKVNEGETWSRLVDFEKQKKLQVGV